MNKRKTILICTAVVLFIVLLFTFFEFIILRLLGFQYNSVGALIFFFVLYIFFEIPLSIIGKALPKAMKSIGWIRSSKGWFSIVLEVGLTFLLIIALDTFLVNVSISLLGAIVFAFITGLISSKLKEDEPEPPEIDDDEFKKIDERFLS